MASTTKLNSRLKGDLITREILFALAQAGGHIVESFLDPYEKLKITNMFIDEGKIQRFRMRRKLLQMQEQGLISIKEKKGEIKIILETEGQNRVLHYKIDDMKLKKPEWWDRKWRMVLFDIPEEKRSVRNMFKQRLDNLGFVQLQHSVYVHPYECHNEIEFIRTVYDIKQYVKILLVDKIEGETILRKRFEI